MRIITGLARGIKLVAPEGLSTRPTIERVKEAVFSSISDEVFGGTVLDYFAGSGQMGLEALSRGAKSCDFVENSAAAKEVINKNIKNTRLCGAQVMDSPRAGGRYSLVFLDPPYGDGVLCGAIAKLCGENQLQKGALLVAESDEKAPILPPSLPLEVSGEKHYGRVCITFIRFKG